MFRRHTCWMFWARIRSGISDGSFSMLLRTVLEAVDKREKEMQKSMNNSWLKLMASLCKQMLKKTQDSLLRCEKPNSQHPY